jgi:prepilin-type N-terminal cleavage/methylation domain-containing protein
MCSHARIWRSAFTLIELLLSISIIGVLIALLLPAVQSAREAVRRTQCGNNLRQIALAFQLHHDQLNLFPSGGWDWWSTPTYVNGLPATGEQQQAGWGFQILPYLEAGNTWRGGQATTDVDRIRVAIGAPNNVFFCPTRRLPQTVAFSDPGYLDGIAVTCALCDYAAGNWEETGVVRYRYPIRVAEITDGASNTLLVAEKRLNLSLLGQRQKDDDIGYTSGFDPDVIRRTTRPPAPDYRAAQGDGDIRFGSSHVGRMNSVLADGSVHMISYSIDPVIFGYLGSRGDGQVANAADF